MFYYAQAIADSETSVYLSTCSASVINQSAYKEIFPNVFILENNTITNGFSGTFRFVKNLYKFSQEATEEQSFLFYPSPLIYLELFALFYLKFKKKCRVFNELNEIRKYSSTFHKKMSLKRPVYSIKKVIYKTTFASLERLLKYYDGLICISTAIEGYGKRFNSSTIRIPILTNPNLVLNYSSGVYHQKERFNIGFSGSIHPTKENLANFLGVLGKMKTHNYAFHLNLCGNIKSEHASFLFDEVANDVNIKENISYYGNLDAKELSTFLSQQQLLVIPRGYTPQNNYGFSTKLSDYLDHGKPVLVTDVSDNKLYIQDGKNGFIIPTDDNTKMYDKLTQIINDYDSIYEDIQKHAVETSRQHFYYKNFHDALGEFLFEH